MLQRDKVKDYKINGHIVIVGETRNAYRSLVGKYECKKPLGKTRRRWETNIQLSLTEIGCSGVECIHLDQNIYK